MSKFQFLIAIKSVNNNCKMSEETVKKKVSEKIFKFKKQTILAGVFILISIALFYVNNNYEIEITQRNDENSNENLSSNAPKYCVYNNNNHHHVLSTVEKVLNMMGLQKVECLTGGVINKDCNIFWTYNYPFNLNFTFKKLESHQKLNHIPGNYALASKSILGTTTDLKYIPKAFMSSNDLQKYAEKYPGKRFVQKLKNNRGVGLKKASEMNFTETTSNEDYFGQEFIENPLLFDGHKFDLGVYVVITSVNPLRFYYYSENLMIRICPLPYDPDNFNDTRTYVINNEHIACSKFKKIEEYYNKGYNYKAAMNTYFTEKGYDMNKVWNQIEDCIRSVIVSKNDNFMKAVSYHN